MIQTSLSLVLASLLQGHGDGHGHAAAAVAEQVPALMVWLIPLLPAFGFLFQVFIGSRKLPKPVVGFISCGVVLASCALSWLLFFKLKASGTPIEAYLGRWIPISGLDGRPGGPLSVLVQHKLVVDQLTSVMILVITNIGFLIHVYSMGYMAEEKRYARYFSYLNLFTGFMLILVMSSNLILMFVGWEGVGLCSYLLIGFWYEKKENALAGMKAFIVNRVGDLAFTIGVLTLFVYLGNTFGVWTVDFQELRKVVTANSDKVAGVATFVAIMLFIGATGKSAQLPLYTWLPDAMAGPTPVSALIHAATMVTAGVYMIARMNFLFSLSPTAMAVVATVGAVTALFAGTIGIAQNDIKKVLAYSTVSQLGFMFMGVGVGAYAAGVFHLFTHAFFKACLFLGSGSVIHGMGHEQDIRKMGALKSKMPVTWATFGLATLAIAGIPPFAGFFSKDEILWMTFSTHAFPNAWGKVLWLLGVVAAACTAFYMTRLVIKTFLGRAQWASASAFSGGGVDLPDWMEEDEEKKKDPGHGHGHDEHSPAADLPQDESLLDLGKVHKDDAHAPHDAGHGQDAGHGGEHGHAGEPHESPPSMLFALVVLAAGSVLVGVLGMPHWMPWGDQFGKWLHPVIHEYKAESAPHDAKHEPTKSPKPGDEHHGPDPVELGLMAFSVIVAVGGIGAAWHVYSRRTGVPAKDFAEKHHDLYDLVLNKYKVDELYDAIAVQPLLNLNEVAGRFDNEVVDGTVNGIARCGSTCSKGAGIFDNEVVDGAVNAAAVATQAASRKIRRLQTGNIKDYLTFALVGGLFVIAAFCLFLTWPDLYRRLFGG